MGFFNRLFRSEPDFSEQLSDRGVAWLVANVHTVSTDTLDFVEPGAPMSFASGMFTSNAMAEFEDPDLGILFGQSRGRAIISMSHLRRVIAQHGRPIRCASDLLTAFRTQGFRIKRVEYL